MLGILKKKGLQHRLYDKHTNRSMFWERLFTSVAFTHIECLTPIIFRGSLSTNVSRSPVTQASENMNEPFPFKW